MSRRPYFKFYFDDFLTGCLKSGMTAEEVGMYVMALGFIWSDEGRTSADAGRLGIRSGFGTKVARRLLAQLKSKGKLVEQDGTLTNARMEREIVAFVNVKKAAQEREEKKRNGIQVDFKSVSNATQTPLETNKNPKTPDKSTDVGARTGHIPEARNQKPEREEKKERNNSPPASTVPVAAGGPASVPEIGALNGATAMIVNDLAKWINPYVPQYELAHNEVKQAVAAYGDRAVRDGYMDLKADHADGKVRALTVKAFYGFCRVAKERGQARDSKAGRGKSKVSRW